ncbi:hypothetical protein J437_LFUL019160 [Ladona fulva]|uniref:DUF4781 domain-containing protein n=1 Tax=Ladona fulva TaxID=123851 RepID=A0A8K0KQ26_LADFU|nr:hypothetical protein J437_LFUL019160 [Ladona fulva]
MSENSNQSEKELAEWKRGALQLQQEFYEKLGDRRWDLIKSDESWALESKVAFAMFGEPKEEEKPKNKDEIEGKKENAVFIDEELKAYYEHGLKTGYTKQQRETIRKICDKIYETVNSKEILVAFLFVIGKSGSGSFIIPFFRVTQHPIGEVYFIDNVCRVYKNWKGYKKNNKLPAAKVLYPVNGIYDSNENGDVLVEYAETPASSIAAKALVAGDTGVGITSLVAAGVGVASIFFPPVAPVAAAAAWAGTGCGIYGASRGSYNLYDRSKHAESISLTDSEARNCWLSVVGSAFGVGSGLAMKGMVAAVAQGRVVGTAGQVLVNFLNFGALTVNGLGIANHLAILVDKRRNNDLTAMDVLQFGTSVLFFTNSAMNAKTAATVIQQVQNDTLSNFTSDLSKKRTRAYNKLVKNSGGDGTMENRARIIKGITNVGSKDEFFRMAIRAQKQSSSTVLNDKGNLVVGGEAYVDTDIKLQTHVKMNSSNTNSISSLPSSSYSPSNKHETIQSLAYIIKTICIENRKEFLFLANKVKIQMMDLYDYFVRLFKRYFSFKGKSTFPSSKIIDFINSSENFARSKGCITKEDYFDFARFLCIYQKSKLIELESSYEIEKNKVMKLLGGKFNESEFACKREIEDVNDRESSFLKIINDEITLSKVDLKEKFEASEKEISAINEDGGLKFRTKYCALNEYYHCFMVDGEELSPTEFFSVIRNTVIDEKSQIIIDEGSKINTYHNNYALVNVKESDDGFFLDSVQLLKGSN